jgi:DNA modification methylase
MIYAYTQKGETVFDPFSGSGSTAVACIHTGRKFIGSELYKEYYDKSLERIDNMNPLGV